MTAVDGVFTFLEEQGLAGGSTGWSLVRRRLHDDDGDRLVVVREDGGALPEFPAATGIGDAAMGDAGVHVTVRARALDGDASGEKAMDILSALHGRVNTALTSGGMTYLRIRALTAEPVFTGYDDKRRPVHTVAFRLLREV